MKVNLTKQQEELKKIIEENLFIAKDWKEKTQEEVNQAFKVMAESAHLLHMQLEPKPKHHSYMIENRNMSPEDPRFYNHIHPVEDLLEYLEDTHANDDPIDFTIGENFEFQVYSSRWGHKDRYEITRTEKGWHVKHLSYDGEDSINDEMKTLYSAMTHDSISYPRNVDSYLNSIWQQAKDKGLTKEEVQEMLNRVAEWISKTEKNAPRDLLY